MKLLLIEDSDRLRSSLTRCLQAEGFTIDAAIDGIQAVEYLRRYGYDLMILDLGLPRLDGFGVLRALPSREDRPRILVLSARDRVADRVDALNAGADDYLVKPFALDELLARLHALARRPAAAPLDVLRCAGITVEPQARRAAFHDVDLNLTPHEFELLTLLLRHRGRTFHRSAILERISGSDSDASDRSIEVLVFNLRHKLSAAGAPSLVENRRGAGYLIP